MIEGGAEAANSFLKILSGHLSDRWQVRKPIVIAGYSLSSLVRPLVALVTTWPQLLAVRLADRVGKGIRGAPRDALLAAAATPANRGRIFGFHRAMDHVGAMTGPLLASLFLLAFPGQYRWLFAATLVPGAIAVWLLFLVPERREESSAEAAPHPARTDVSSSSAELEDPARRDEFERPSWRALPGRYFTVLGVVLVFTLGNSADAFLLLRLGERGVAPAAIPLLWALLHAIKAATSVWGGTLSDRWGRRPVIGAGWVVYAVVYLGFATSTSVGTLIGWFLVYGLYFGLSEGTEKALVADLAPSTLRGTSFGLFNAATGVGALLASLVFGLVWQAAGPAAAFAMGAALALLAAALLFALVREPGRAVGY